MTRQYLLPNLLMRQMTNPSLIPPKLTLETNEIVKLENSTAEQLPGAWATLKQWHWKVSQRGW